MSRPGGAQRGGSGGNGPGKEQLKVGVGTKESKVGEEKF